VGIIALGWARLRGSFARHRLTVSNLVMAEFVWRILSQFTAAECWQIMRRGREIRICISLSDRRQGLAVRSRGHGMPCPY
jgi:hypothetical protein